MNGIGSWRAKLLGALAALAGVVLSIRLYGESTTEPDGRSWSRSDHDRGSPYALALPTHDEPLRPGWSRPAPERMPRPTYWPMVFALGVAFFAWGIIANLFVIGLGFTLLVVGLVGWAGDLLGEFAEE